MWLHLVSNLLLLSSACSLSCRAILVGTTDNQTATTTTTTGETNNNSVDKLQFQQQQQDQNATKLDSNSSFYYEADTFLQQPNKANKLEDVATHSSVQKTSTNGNKTSINDSKKPLDENKSASKRIKQTLAISGRSGRMLDLDALMGDMETARANKEMRSQITSRQSRNLGSISGGKRLHIQGFIPIVGIKDEHEPDNDDDNHHSLGGLAANLANEQLQQAASIASPQRVQYHEQRPKMISASSAAAATAATAATALMGNNQLQAASLKNNLNADFPLGVGSHSSLGHASFNVQRFLNTDQTGDASLQSQDYNNINNNNKWAAQGQLLDQSNQRASETSGKHSGGIVDTLKKPIKKLTNSFSLSSLNLGANNANNQQQLQAVASQQQNCLCVPFYMCKNGFINESALGRSQLQQLLQQNNQQARYLPATISGNFADSAAQAAESQQQYSSAPLSAQASFANSLVPVDERSLERDIITAAPPSSSSIDLTSSLDATATPNNQSAQPNENTSSLSSQSFNADGNANDNATRQRDELTAELAGLSLTAASSNTSSGNSFLTGPTNSDEMTSINQASDYSKDILGRMLGLRAGSRVSMLGGSATTTSQQQASSLVSMPSSGASGASCGLLRTCCNIAQAPLSSASLEQQAAEAASNKVAATASAQAVALQRYYNLSPNSGQQQISRMQQQQQQQQASSNFGMPMSLSQLASMPHAALQKFAPANNQLALYEPNNQFQHKTYPQLDVHRAGSSAPQQQQRPAMTGINQFGRANGPSANGPFISQPVGLNMAQQQQQQQQAFQKAVMPAGNRRLLEGRCGLRQSSGVNGRVQNLQYTENSAEFGEYPAQAAILRRLNGSESLFVCSGTLISQSWVATAAHCIRKSQQAAVNGNHQQQQQQLKVRLGEWDVHRDDEFYPFVEKDVRDLIVHPDFVPGNLINDIALLRLDSPLDPSLPHINPACLPTADESFARQRCWVTGWGKDTFGQRGSFQSVLQEVELPVHGHAECEQALRKTRLGPHYRLHAGFICAGGENGKDACEGDGGSGLYCVHEGVLKVAGLVSWGIGCGQAGVPGVYVNMAAYRPWIESIISLDEDIYSSYGQLPASSLISERSNTGAAGNGNGNAKLPEGAANPATNVTSLDQTTTPAN